MTINQCCTPCLRPLSKVTTNYADRRGMEVSLYDFQDKDQNNVVEIWLDKNDTDSDCDIIYKIVSEGDNESFVAEYWTCHTQEGRDIQARLPKQITGEAGIRQLLNIIAKNSEVQHG